MVRLFRTKEIVLSDNSLFCVKIMDHNGTIVTTTEPMLLSHAQEFVDDLRQYTIYRVWLYPLIEEVTDGEGTWTR
jgi:hypothetical protein